MTNVISNSISQNVTLSAGGNYQSPLTITTTGTVAPGGSGNAVYGSAASGLTLINQGVITGGNDSAASGGAGVELIGAGAFDNTGVITGGSGSLGGAGVNLSGSGNFQNSGTIAGGVGTYAAAYGLVLSGNNNFSNTGLIIGGINSFSTGGGAVDWSGSGTFTNNALGTLIGGVGYPFSKGGFGFYGSSLSTGTFINDGSIVGASASSSGDGGMGVALFGTGYAINHGIIAGGTYGGDGVGLYGAGSFTNAGTIRGGSGAGNGAGQINGAAIKLVNGTASNEGVVIGGSGGNVDAGVYIVSGTLIDSGRITGGTNSAGVQDAVLFAGYGTSSPTLGTATATLLVESGAVFVGDVVANATLADVLALGGSAAVTLSGIGTQFTNFHTLTFEPGATGIVSGTYTGFAGLAINQFAVGDTLVLDGFGATKENYVSGVGLELSNSTSTITLDITGNFSTANFNGVDGAANTKISLKTACFAAGTRILTRQGEIPVEALQAGDELVLHGGGTSPIQWIGQRKLALNKHPHPERVNPVRIAAGALMDGVPRRDLVLSPDHALYINGTLIPAKALVNGSTIRQETRKRITYYHIELAHHAVLYAEGTPAESYLETGNRSAFANGGAPMMLHPDFAQTLREQRGCAPFIEVGPIVEAIRAKILARAQIALSDDYALSVADRPDGAVAIKTRSEIPGHIGADPRDQRRLGVKIGAIYAGLRQIALDDPRLCDGWHAPELAGRWTNGCAIIPAELVRGEAVRIEIVAATKYRIKETMRQRV